MTIPKELKIGGHVYKIVFKEDPVADGEECPAYIDDERMEIVLGSKAGWTVREASLLHEALHAMNASLDHALLDSLAEQIYQMLKENDMLK